jgi:hypothetical protein
MEGMFHPEFSEVVRLLVERGEAGGGIALSR